MKMSIETIIGEKLNPRGTSKDIEKSINSMKEKLGNPHPDHLAILFNKNIFTPIEGDVGTWGNLGGAKLTFKEDNGNMHDISLIWRYVNEFENIEESLNNILSTFDWLEIADRWNIKDW